VDIKRVFKEEWVARFPWVKPMVAFACKLQMVHCKVCSMVQNKEKLLNPKLMVCKNMLKKKENTNSPSRSSNG